MGAHGKARRGALAAHRNGPHPAPAGGRQDAADGHGGRGRGHPPLPLGPPRRLAPFPRPRRGGESAPARRHHGTGPRARRSGPPGGAVRAVVGEDTPGRPAGRCEGPHQAGAQGSERAAGLAGSRPGRLGRLGRRSGQADRRGGPGRTRGGPPRALRSPGPTDFPPLGGLVRRARMDAGFGHGSRALLDHDAPLGHRGTGQVPGGRAGPRRKWPGLPARPPGQSHRLPLLRGAPGRLRVLRRSIGGGFRRPGRLRAVLPDGLPLHRRAAPPRRVGPRHRPPRETRRQTRHHVGRFREDSRRRLLLPLGDGAEAAQRLAHPRPLPRARRGGGPDRRGVQSAPVRRGAAVGPGGRVAPGGGHRMGAPRGRRLPGGAAPAESEESPAPGPGPARAPGRHSEGGGSGDGVPGLPRRGSTTAPGGGSRPRPRPLRARGSGRRCGGRGVAPRGRRLLPPARRSPGRSRQDGGPLRGACPHRPRLRTHVLQSRHLVVGGGAGPPGRPPGRVAGGGLRGDEVRLRDHPRGLVGQAFLVAERRRLGPVAHHHHRGGRHRSRIPARIRHPGALEHRARRGRATGHLGSAPRPRLAH